MQQRAPPEGILLHLDLNGPGCIPEPPEHRCLPGDNNKKVLKRPYAFVQSRASLKQLQRSIEGKNQAERNEYRRSLPLIQNSFCEVVVDEQQIYFYLDLDLKDVPMVVTNLQEAEGAVEAVVAAIIETFNELFAPYTVKPEDFIIFDKSDVGRGLFSYHIKLHNYVFQDLENLRHFAEHHALPRVSEELRPAIDTSVWNPSSEMQVAGSHKRNDYRPKTIVNKWRFRGETIITDYSWEDSFITVVDEEHVHLPPLETDTEAEDSEEEDAMDTATDRRLPRQRHIQPCTLVGQAKMAFEHFSQTEHASGFQPRQAYAPGNSEDVVVISMSRDTGDTTNPPCVYCKDRLDPLKTRGRRHASSEYYFLVVLLERGEYILKCRRQQEELKKDKLAPIQWLRFQYTESAVEKKLSAYFDRSDYIGQWNTRVLNEEDLSGGKYLSRDLIDQVLEDIPHPDKPATILVESSMGSAKTTMFIHHILTHPEIQKVCCFAGRQQYASELTAKLNGSLDAANDARHFTCYNEPGLVSLRYTDCLVVEVESLRRIQELDEPFDMLIMDESELVLGQTTCKETHQNGLALLANVEMLDTVWKTTPLRIVCEALMSNKTRSTIHEMTSAASMEESANVQYVINTVMPPRHRAINHKNRVQELHAVLEQHIEQGKRVIYYTATLERTKAWFEIAKERLGLEAKDVLFYHREMPQDVRDTVEFLNEAWKQCKLIIYSPVINVGISYDPIDPAAFDSMFVLASPFSANPHSGVQSTARCRQWSEAYELHYAICTTGPYDKLLQSPPTTAQEAKAQAAARLQLLKEVQEHLDMTDHVWAKAPQWWNGLLEHNRIEAGLSRLHHEELWKHYLENVCNYEIIEAESLEQCRISTTKAKSHLLYREIPNNTSEVPDDELASTLERAITSKHVFRTILTAAELDEESREYLFDKIYAVSNNKKQILWNVWQEKNISYERARKDVQFQGELMPAEIAGMTIVKAHSINRLCQQMGIKHTQDEAQRISSATLEGISSTDIHSLAHAFGVKTPVADGFTVSDKVSVISKVLSMHSGFTFVAELARDAHGNIEYHAPTKTRGKRRPKKKYVRSRADQRYELRPCPNIYAFYNMIRGPTPPEDNATWQGIEDENDEI